MKLEVFPDEGVAYLGTQQAYDAEYHAWGMYLRHSQTGAFIAKKAGFIGESTAVQSELFALDDALEAASNFGLDSVTVRTAEVDIVRAAVRNVLEADPGHAIRGAVGEEQRCIAEILDRYRYSFATPARVETVQEGDSGLRRARALAVSAVLDKGSPEVWPEPTRPKCEYCLIRFL